MGFTGDGKVPHGASAATQAPGEPSKAAVPYGLWQSDITKDAVFGRSRNMSSPRVCRRTGRVFFCEGRPDGANHIVEIHDGECRDVLPAGFSARTRVYEYGGNPYAILPASRIIFSNFKDNSVNVLDVDAGQSSRLIYSDTLRYADFDVHPGDEPWVLAVEEDHAIEVPDKVRNYLVSINTATGEVRRIAEGADFYMFPGFSHDGRKVCWVEWDFPGMPWAGVRLYWADWAEGSLKPNTTELVAGSDSATVTEPRWGPDGHLYYCLEQTNYYQLYRRKPANGDGQLIKLIGLESAEFGHATFSCGGRSYAILSDRRLVASITDNGSDRTISVDLETMEHTELPLGYSALVNDGLERLSENSFLIIGGSSNKPGALAKVTFTESGAKHDILRKSTDDNFSSSIFSLPEAIRFPAKKGPEREVCGFFWPPHNPAFKGPEGEKPPLIIQSHGGPTSHTAPALMFSLQYWNSRGYATFAINYTGSTGYGKAYRQLLNSRWGIIDVDDVAECVQYLVQTGRVDGSRIGIRGGSAGGYSVLQALCCYPNIFAGGVCLYGISEVKLLLDTTHKMECRYVDMLMFTEGMTDTDRQKVMHERSPVYHAGQITAPLLILHGEEDEVVPISQAYTMYDDITKRGGDVRLVKFPGEGHGFRNGSNLLKAQEEEEAWWKKTLVKV